MQLFDQFQDNWLLRTKLYQNLQNVPVAKQTIVLCFSARKKRHLNYFIISAKMQINITLIIGPDLTNISGCVRYHSNCYLRQSKIDLANLMCSLLYFVEFRHF